MVIFAGLPQLAIAGLRLFELALTIKRLAVPTYRAVQKVRLAPLGAIGPTLFDEFSGSIRPITMQRVAATLGKAITPLDFFLAAVTVEEFREFASNQAREAAIELRRAIPDIRENYRESVRIRSDARAQIMQRRRSIGRIWIPAHSRNGVRVAGHWRQLG